MLAVFSIINESTFCLNGIAKSSWLLRWCQGRFASPWHHL